jgi:hypothetical protein
MFEFFVREFFITMDAIRIAFMRRADKDRLKDESKGREVEAPQVSQ